ncbi:MAG: metal-sensitive transcriptional regulator [Betaproteobacteria bacterium]
MAEDVSEKPMDWEAKPTNLDPRGEPDVEESDGPDEGGLGASAGWESRGADALDLDALTLSENARNDILSRLKRIEGQARGIRRMIEDGRSCDEVVIQVAALKAAVAQVGIAIAGSHLVDCVARDMGASPASRAALARFVKIFSKLS